MMIDVEQKAKEYILTSLGDVDIVSIIEMFDVGGDDAEDIYNKIQDAHVKITFDNGDE